MSDQSTDISDLLEPTAVEPAGEFAKPGDQQLIDTLPKIESPLQLWYHNYQMLQFMRKMRTVPYDAIDDAIVAQTYPAAVWKMREFALSGMYTETRAMELWLKWADHVKSRPKHETKTESKGSAVFGAREPEKTEEEPEVE